MRAISLFFRRLRRTARLVRVYWTTVEGDWSAIAIVMRHEIREQRLHILEHNFIENAETYARQMLVAETALTRLLSDFRADPKETERLARTMRFLTNWWD